MWLLNAKTRKLEAFASHLSVKYAILSHTWGKDEVTHTDLVHHRWKAKRKAGFRKIRFVCDQALKDGLAYAWVDTCCIDKSSSAELSEAINSMWTWYQWAGRCYALLDDVGGVGAQKYDSQSTFEDSNAGKDFRSSRWFTRGWTLQELLVPGRLIFYGRNGGVIGDRADLADVISTITAIPVDTLKAPLKTWVYGLYSVAQRMSWYGKRQTSRPEDEAYCLLGLFDVNMPLLYGEGGMKAFQRLQEEIMKRSTDHSILAWHKASFTTRLLATCPGDFADSGDIQSDDPAESYEMTNRGLRITLPLVYENANDFDLSVIYYSYAYDAVLNCSQGGYPVSLRLYIKDTDTSGYQYQPTQVGIAENNSLDGFIPDGVNASERQRNDVEPLTPGTAFIVLRNSHTDTVARMPLQASKRSITILRGRDRVMTKG
jgi:hypothetical protein